MNDIKKMPQVFDYLEFSDFLKEVYEFKKSQNTMYTRNSFSRSLGYTTSSFVNQVMSLTRKPNIKLVNKISENLKLEKKEVFYLTMLMLKAHIMEEKHFIDEFYDKQILEKLSQEPLA